MTRNRMLALVAAWMLFAPLFASAESVDVQAKPLPAIQPGTILAKPAPQGWTHLVLFARPRLAAGDVDAAPDTAKRFAAMFSTAIVARVKEQSGQFQLDEVAMGLAMDIDGKQTIVDSNTAAALGGKLGLFGGRVLSAAEEALKEVKQIARYETMMLFDAKALVHHNNEHQEMLVRHLIWVSKKTGQLGAALWLQEPGDSGFQLAQDHFVVLPPTCVEDRVLHVDKTKFTLGVPGKTAFALERLPRGTEYAFTPALRATASLGTFTPAQVQELAVSFSQAVAQGPSRKLR
ncbi:MAG: hypothetical protein KDB14_13270 [Planctomycetales bacterium]|nr:hypothetical protein [Planctomycetales bacterium]